jgi:hypothetical protein
VIFHTIYKSNGRNIARLDHSSMKQIGGRAGRRNSPFKFGEVTTRVAEDLVHIREALATEIEQIPKAGLLPTVEHVESFALALAEQEKREPPLSEVVDKFGKLAKIEGDFFLCRQEAIGAVAKRLDDVKMELTDKYLFCVAPVNGNDQCVAARASEAMKRARAAPTTGASNRRERQQPTRAPTTDASAALQRRPRSCASRAGGRKELASAPTTARARQQLREQIRRK